MLISSNPHGSPSACVRRHAFTLIEILTVLAVIGLLAGLLLPAVASARESARRIRCVNNLRQLGLALNNYASALGVLPPGGTAIRFSPQVMLLPYLEQKPLYDAINFQGNPTISEGTPNATAAATSLSVLLCPSDGQPSGAGGCTNYAGSVGNGVGWYGTNGAFVVSPDSAVVVGFRDFADGAGATAVMAEWLLGPARPDVKAPGRSVAQLAAGGVPLPPEDFAARCHSLDLAAIGLDEISNDKGLSWLSPRPEDTLYDHVLPINDNSCTNGAISFDGALSAGSAHPGGANVLFLDGHVRFLKESISSATWRALGSRSGGEVIAGDAF
jgi:prepilin-type processing-associated H-X9-DG protein/prepilin-type N-terminal cleavage/methylation domain-containing protein